MKVAVVTPTIGTRYLKRCISSVAAQDYTELSHYLFIDGKKSFARTKEISSRIIKKVVLEENVGGGGWLGHRAYASCSFLVNSDLICYLDEDNWIEPDHVSSLVNEIKSGRDWAFSLRKIYSKNGSYLFEDNCESLGLWPVYNNPNSFHVDTSSYIVKTEVAAQIGHTWYKKWDADRQFFANIRHFFPNFSCSGNYSLCYRLGGNQNSVCKEFFEIGNTLYSSRFSNFPWRVKN